MLAFAALKGASWLVFSRFVGRFIDFFNVLILARLLSPAEFGLAALAMALVVVIDTVLEVPVTQALVRLPVLDKSHLDTGFTLGVLRSSVIAVIFLVATWPYSLVNGNPLLVPVIAAMALGPIAKGFMSPAMVHFARALEFRPTFAIETISKLCAFVAAVATVAAGGGYWAIVVNFVTTAFVATVASYAVAPYRPAFSLNRLSDFAGFIGWFSSAQLVSALNWQFDRFLIGSAGNSAMLGRYAVASDIAVIPTQSIIGPALQPVMAAFSQISSNADRMRTAFLKASRFAMLISLPVCVGLSLTADLVTAILLGAQWSDAAPYLNLLALSVIPIPYFQTLYSASLALDRPSVIFRLNVIDLCFRVVLISVGFYLLAAHGASIGRILVASVMAVFYVVEAWRLFGLGPWQQLRNLWKVLTSAAVMAIAVIWLRTGMPASGLPVVIQLIAVASAGAATYLVTLFALGMRIALTAGRPDLVDR
ncbi:oligosaccharide flippase family protein [Neorhizobium galegae]|uniref:oligosaccharide flippase family protein n=1 Tax=Neorhizobium galegae TaxID=399 RepID=UPI0006224FEA|nr:oligosaccharide flippase family protein [Neorhizobium galegae]KAB1120072.1 oligosaccharide flippase family protein [Neorhizobium galegae]MCQ1809016.1 oligosaccharide flippase family protein [Neorhizobium galegae]CDZ64486.1 Colanic acid exporter [Neorhizobium galegae bv. orientalis]